MFCSRKYEGVVTRPHLLIIVATFYGKWGWHRMSFLGNVTTSSFFATITISQLTKLLSLLGIYRTKQIGEKKCFGIILQ